MRKNTTEAPRTMFAKFLIFPFNSIAFFKDFPNLSQCISFSSSFNLDSISYMSSFKFLITKTFLSSILSIVLKFELVSLISFSEISL